MTTKFSAYDKITNQIIEALEQGEIPYENGRGCRWASTEGSRPNSEQGRNLI